MTFHVNWECHHPNWLNWLEIYFSEGLVAQPPTRYMCVLQQTSVKSQVQRRVLRSTATVGLRCWLQTKNWRDTIQSINHVHTSNTWGTTRDRYFWDWCFVFFYSLVFVFFVVLLAFVVFVCSAPSLFLCFLGFLFCCVVSWKYAATMVQTTRNTSIRQNKQKN